jgi:hypothetical protein
MYKTVANTFVSYEIDREKIRLCRVLGLSHDFWVPKELQALNNGDPSTAFEFSVIRRQSVLLNAGQLSSTPPNPPPDPAVKEHIFQVDWPCLYLYGAGPVDYSKLMPEPLDIGEVYAVSFGTNMTLRNNFVQLFVDLGPSLIDFIIVEPDVQKNKVSREITPPILVSSTSTESLWQPTQANQTLAKVGGYIEFTAEDYAKGEWFFNRPYYDTKSGQTSYFSSGCLFPVLYQADYYLENKTALLFLEVNNIHVLGGTMVDGKQTNLSQLISTINANPFGAISSQIVTVDSFESTLVKSFSIGTNVQDIKAVCPPKYPERFGENATATYDTVYVVYPGRPVKYNQTSDFTALQQTPNGNGQPTTLTITPKSNNLEYLEFKIVNEMGNEMEYIQALSNATPFSQLVFSLKVFPGDRSQVNLSLQPRLNQLIPYFPPAKRSVKRRKHKR